jgi:hypothetical protein
MIRDDSRHRITPKETWIEGELQENQRLVMVVWMVVAGREEGKREGVGLFISSFF